MDFVNRYSLFVVGGALALAGAVLAALSRPGAGAVVTLSGLFGTAALWTRLRTGRSTLGDASQLRSRIGAGRPVLVLLFSDT